MIEQNAAAAKDLIRLAVIDGHPVCIQLGHTVRAARIKRRIFHLRHRLHLAEHFRSRGLIKTYARVHDAYRFEHIDRTDAGDFRSGDGLIERDADKTLCSEVIYFSGAAHLQQADT